MGPVQLIENSVGSAAVAAGQSLAEQAERTTLQQSISTGDCTAAITKS